MKVSISPTGLPFLSVELKKILCPSGNIDCPLESTGSISRLPGMQKTQDDRIRRWKPSKIWRHFCFSWSALLTPPEDFLRGHLLPLQALEHFLHFTKTRNAFLTNLGGILRHTQPHRGPQNLLDVIGTSVHIWETRWSLSAWVQHLTESNSWVPSPRIKRAHLYNLVKWLNCSLFGCSSIQRDIAIFHYQSLCLAKYESVNKTHLSLETHFSERSAQRQCRQFTLSPAVLHIDNFVSPTSTPYCVESPFRFFPSLLWINK